MESSETPVPIYRTHGAKILNPGNVHLNNLKAPSSMCYVQKNCYVDVLSSTNLTEVFPCFLSCKANSRLKLPKKRHGPQSSKLVVICVVLRIVYV